MDFQLFNIGPLELVFILILMLILLGPDGMSKSARTLGLWIHRLVRSPLWASMMTYWQDLRDLPNNIVREAGIEESLAELREKTRVTIQPPDFTPADEEETPSINPYEEGNLPAAFNTPAAEPKNEGAVEETQTPQTDEDSPEIDDRQV
jgi:hypothetical protein